MGAIDTWPPASSASRLTTKANTGGGFTISATVTGNTSSIGAATWAQLTASLAQEAYIYGVAFRSSTDMGSASKFVQFQLGIGAAASETSLIEVMKPLINPGAATFYGGDYVSIPWLRVSASTRVAARICQSSTGAGSINWTLDAHCMPYTSMEGN